MPDIGQGEFTGVVVAVDEQMEMVLVRQERMRRVAPFLGVAMEADHQIGPEIFVDPLRARPDLADPVKK